jgi:exonuclease III
MLMWLGVFLIKILSLTSLTRSNHIFYVLIKPKSIKIYSIRIQFELKGYSGHCKFCKVSTGYSGVDNFSKFRPVSFVEASDEPAFSQEGRVLKLKFLHFYLVSVYIPSAGDKN